VIFTIVLDYYVHCLFIRVCIALVWRSVEMKSSCDQRVCTRRCWQFDTSSGFALSCVEVLAFERPAHRGPKL